MVPLVQQLSLQVKGFRCQVSAKRNSEPQNIEPQNFKNPPRPPLEKGEL